MKGIFIIKKQQKKKKKKKKKTKPFMISTSNGRTFLWAYFVEVFSTTHTHFSWKPVLSKR